MSFYPVKCYAAPEWDEAAQVNDPALGVIPQAVNMPGHKAGAMKPPKTTTKPSDLVEGALVVKGSKTLKALSRSVNGQPPTQRDITAFLAEKAQREKDDLAVKVDAVPNPMFERPEFAMVPKERRGPSYGVQASTGIVGSLIPTGFMKASQASRQLIRDAQAKFEQPSGPSNPTGGIDEGRVGKLNAALVKAYGTERY